MSKTLLLVENEPTLRESFQKEFGTSGYVLKTAATGDEALYHLKHNNVDLMIIDIESQSKDSQNSIRDFLDIDENIKVVIHMDFPDSDSAFNSWSADSFVMKSDDLSELRNTIHDLLNPLSEFAADKF